jgi:polyhydroxyalkanoate synthesis regulator phasin
MNKRLIALILGFAIIMTAAIASAGVFDREIADQQRLIDRGTASGKLTHHEAEVVQDNLNYVRNKLDSYKGNDGKLDRRERTRLERMLQRNDRMIRKLKNNAVQRAY